MTKKLTTYVITVSETFPKKHSLSGEPTGFVPQILGKRKIHTIRANYALWAKRFEKIDRGEACLSVRVWTGKPYRSKQEEVLRLTKKDGIGLQKLVFYNGCIALPTINTGKLEDSICAEKELFSCQVLARNDGLFFEHLKEWFEGYNLDEPMAIIHFSDFRYV